MKKSMALDRAYTGLSQNMFSKATRILLEILLNNDVKNTQVIDNMLKKIY